MSTQQVERLQALLQRVQHNRGGVRPAVVGGEAPAPRSGGSYGGEAPALRGGASSNVTANATASRPGTMAAPQQQAPAAKKPAQGPTTPVGMPTPARMAAAPAPAVEDELDFSSLPPPGASRAPAQEPAFTPAERRNRPGATPLEMAFEEMPDRPVVAPVVPLPTRAATAPVAVAPAPAAPAAPVRRDGVVLADQIPPAPARPIAQVLSKQPPVVPVSFGDLLKRSLSLRPR